MFSYNRLNIPLGEAIFTQRAIRRFKPDPIPEQDVHEILQAAIRAPSASNSQPWHFLVIRDSTIRSNLAKLYHEAWWAKRRDAGIKSPDDVPPGKGVIQSAMKLADQIGQAPVIIILCATSRGPGPTASVIPAAQNLLLAARALEIGATITTLHPDVEERVHELLNIPNTAQVVYCIPMGYPKGQFGTTTRKPLSEVSSSDLWGNKIS